ncbi:MAG: hypothetical protein LAP86_25800 [Acidobacteriia bacterium]|nr:hypothetical protein [Terriglobia bacterium]
MSQLITITFEDARRILFRTDGAPRTNNTPSQILARAIGPELYAQLQKSAKERAAGGSR